MRHRLDRLWSEIAPGDGRYPAPDVRRVKARVNEALNAVPSERSSYMRQKLRAAVVLAAAALLLAGTALAAVSRWNVLDYYFEGDTTPAQSYLNTQAYSVSDDNYTFSVTSSAADSTIAYVLLRVEAKNETAREELQSETFLDMDTFSFGFMTTPADAEGDSAYAPSSAAMEIGEEAHLRTESSRTWSVELRPVSQDTCGIWLRLNQMEEGLHLEIPLKPEQPLTLDIDAEGTGRGTIYNIDGGPVTLESLELTSLSLRMTLSYAAESGDVVPLLFFRMKDGSVYTSSQLMDLDSESGDFQASPDSSRIRGVRSYRFRSVVDLSEMDAVVFAGRAYPLDGGPSEAADVPASLSPFQIPLVESPMEGWGYIVPVRALCEGLGIGCHWDNDTQTAQMVYRGVAISVTLGSSTALVDGQPVALSQPAVADGGKLAVACDLFEEAWQLNLFAGYNCLPDEDTQRTAWLVLP